jgi:hypothetical protein
MYEPGKQTNILETYLISSALHWLK